MASSYAGIAVGAGLADREDLERISAAWRTWGEQEDAWFTVVHGEILCRV